MGQKITQRTIKNLGAAEHDSPEYRTAKAELLRDGQMILWDSELKGFGVKITSAGATSFFLNYRVHDRQRRYKIGNAPEWSVDAARAEAAKVKVRIDSENYDPLEAKRKARGEPTLADLATEYLKHRADKSPSTKRNDKQMLEGIILPRLGRLRLASINTRDIESLKGFLQATQYRANRVLALLSHMFGRAMEWRWMKENPVRGVTRYHEEKRERWLSTEELGAFKNALDAYPDQSAANCIRLLMLTGSREGEALRADWSMVDLQRGVWTKPSHHTKQKKTEHVPLSDEALALLRNMKPQSAGPLFPGQNGSRTTLRKPWTQLCKAAGLAEAITVKGKRGRTKTKYKPLIRIHDLRHTFASHLVSKGTSLQIVGRLIGHTQIATTQRYAHLADGALRDATNNFGKIFSSAEATPQAPTRKRAAGE